MDFLYIVPYRYSFKKITIAKRAGLTTDYLDKMGQAGISIVRLDAD